MAQKTNAWSSALPGGTKVGEGGKVDTSLPVMYIDESSLSDAQFSLHIPRNARIDDQEILIQGETTLVEVHIHLSKRIQQYIRVAEKVDLSFFQKVNIKTNVYSEYTEEQLNYSLDDLFSRQKVAVSSKQRLTSHLVESQDISTSQDPELVDGSLVKLPFRFPNNISDQHLGNWLYLVVDITPLRYTAHVNHDFSESAIQSLLDEVASIAPCRLDHYHMKLPVLFLNPILAKVDIMPAMEGQVIRINIHNQLPLECFLPDEQRVDLTSILIKEVQIHKAGTTCHSTKRSGEMRFEFDDLFTVQVIGLQYLPCKLESGCTVVLVVRIDTKQSTLLSHKYLIGSFSSSVLIVWEFPLVSCGQIVTNVPFTFFLGTSPPVGVTVTLPDDRLATPFESVVRLQVSNLDKKLHSYSIYLPSPQPCYETQPMDASPLMFSTLSSSTVPPQQSATPAAYIGSASRKLAATSDCLQSPRTLFSNTPGIMQQTSKKIVHLVADQKQVKSKGKGAVPLVDYCEKVGSEGLREAGELAFCRNPYQRVTDVRPQGNVEVKFQIVAVHPGLYRIPFIGVRDESNGHRFISRDPIFLYIKDGWTGSGS